MPANQELLKLYKYLDLLRAGMYGDRIPLGRYFPQPSRLSLRPNRHPIQRVPGLFPWSKAARGVALTL